MARANLQLPETLFSGVSEFLRLLKAGIGAVVLPLGDSLSQLGMAGRASLLAVNKVV